MEATLKIGKTTIKLAATITRDQRTAQKITQDAAYIELNNLYLGIEAGKRNMSVAAGNQLRTLVGQAYEKDDPMIDWWLHEFSKLPGWLNV